VLSELDRCIADSGAALADDDGQALLDSLTEFSDLMAEACGNARMVKLLADLRSVLLLIGTTSLRAPGREARSIAEHEAILDAIRRGDADGAAAATAAHIRSIEHDSLEPIER
jgi:DNA-binding GntR family transcriptional regulator